jgi:hypothetical protein
VRGNEIVVSANPRGMFMEMYVKTGETHYPGVIVQIDPTVALNGGRHTCKLYAETADGDQPLGAFWVCTGLLHQMTGQPVSSTTGIAAGDRETYYSPMAGEELNLLISNLSGTGDDHSAGDKLMVDTGTGELIATTGTPETEVAVLLESITDPTADTLAWCQWSGH